MADTLPDPVAQPEAKELLPQKNRPELTAKVILDTHVLVSLMRHLAFQ